MSTTVIPAGADGTWIMASISPTQARHIAAKAAAAGHLVSAVGHQSSADAMAVALARPVGACRITVAPQPGDRFLCLRLNSRPPEGCILDQQQLEAIGYGWALLTYEG